MMNRRTIYRLSQLAVIWLFAVAVATVVGSLARANSNTSLKYNIVESVICFEPIGNGTASLVRHEYMEGVNDVRNIHHIDSRTTIYFTATDERIMKGQPLEIRYQNEGAYPCIRKEIPVLDRGGR